MEGGGYKGSGGRKTSLAKKGKGGRAAEVVIRFRPSVLWRRVLLFRLPPHPYIPARKHILSPPPRLPFFLKIPPPLDMDRRG